MSSKPEHRQVARHRPTQRPGPRRRTPKAAASLDAKMAVGGVGPAQQLAGRRVSARLQEVALDHEVVVRDLIPASASASRIAGEPLVVGADVRAAGDEPDASVSQTEEVARCRPGYRSVGGVDDVAAGRIAVVVDEHEGECVRLELLDVLRQPAWQHDEQAVHHAVRQAGDVLGLLLAAAVRRAQQEVVVGRRRPAGRHP